MFRVIGAINLDACIGIPDRAYERPLNSSADVGIGYDSDGDQRLENRVELDRRKADSREHPQTAQNSPNQPRR